MKRSAIILAGGASRRLGVDKGLLMMNSKLLIEYVIESVQPIVDHVYVICSDLQFTKYKKVVTNAEVLIDGYPERSPMIGLISGLRAAKDGYAIVTACDMPLIKTKLVKFLFKQAKGKGGSVVVKPDGWIEPLLGVYHVPTALAEAERLYLAGDLRIRMVIRNMLDIKHVHLEDLKRLDLDFISFMDIDTVENLREVEKLVD
jgi:molybdopterin-guanine dinucleotide biosynthesis protein A